MTTSKMARKSKCLKNILLTFLTIYLIIRKLNKNPPLLRIDRFLPDMKNILIWTDVAGIKDSGQMEFIGNKCKYYNCFVTKNKTLHGGLGYFDAVLFNLQDISLGSDVPKVRGALQKYVLVANDSADNYPICDPVYDDFFNWTWSYRYESTISYRFFTIFNAQYEELGSHFQWYNHLEPVEPTFKSQFATKSKAAVIFMDRCETRSRREKFIENLQINLKEYNLTVDIFGKCGPRECKRRSMNPCFWRLKKTYYFYLAFEDSISFDYITDIVLYAYHNNAVPVVYGGAKYERYLPPGSYINASNMTTKSLAATMFNLMSNREDYFDYFRYKHHYTFARVPLLNVCQLCEVLNNPARLIQPVTYYNFRRWWNPLYEQRCYSRKKFVL